MTTAKPVFRRFLTLAGLFAVVVFPACFAHAAETARVSKPRIVAQPAPLVSADFGTVATLTAVVSSAETPSYVWTKDGVVVPGATTNSLSVTVDEMADAGRYQVTVVNSAGAVKSKVAILRVNLAPAELPSGTALIGAMKMSGGGSSTVEDGSYVIGAGGTIDDPEDATDDLAYTYSRISYNQALLVVAGSYYSHEYGIRPKQVERFLFTFTSANAAGERQAAVKYNGAITLTAGTKSKTFKITGAGSFSFVPPGIAP